MLEPLESNQNFDSLKMVVANDKAFIMAVDGKENQSLYALYHDLSTVTLSKLWSSNSILKIIIRHDFEKKE